MEFYNFVFHCSKIHVNERDNCSPTKGGDLRRTNP